MRLYLLRHGEAVSGAETDRSRPLTVAAQNYLNQLALPETHPFYKCELIVSSPYLRAEQTAKAVAKAVGIQELRIEESLESHSDIESVLLLLEQLFEEKRDQVLLVTHQPIISQFIRYLCDETGVFSPAPAEFAILSLDWSARGLGQLLSWQRL